MRYSRLICLLLIASVLLGILGGCQPFVPGNTSSLGSTGTVSSSSTVAPGTTGTQPSTSVPPTSVPSTSVPPTSIPSTSVPPTSIPSTSVPPTSIPSTSVPPTSVPIIIDPDAPQFPVLHAQKAFIYDTRTQEFLYLTHEEDSTWYPASTTKLFTVYVALQYLQTEDVILVGDEISLVNLDTSRAGFWPGDILTVQDLLYGVLLPSGCDAAYILAAHAGRVILANDQASAADAVTAFVAEMNRQAEALGMVNTHFVTVDGYHDPDHYISMQAFAIIAERCLATEDIAKVVRTYSKTITYTDTSGATKSKALKGTNRTINPYSKDYHKDAVGLKTGSHNAGGGNLLAAYKVEGGYIVIGIFGCIDWNQRFPDANALFNFVKQLL